MAKQKQVKEVETNIPRTVVSIELSRIVPNSLEPQARRRKRFNQDEIESLGKSIVSKGLLQPILVRPIAVLSELKGDYEIVFGEQRWLASKGKKLKTIDCFVRELTNAEVIELQYEENHERKEPDPLDDAFYFKYLQTEENYSVQDLSIKFNISEKAVINKLKFNDLIEEAKQELSDGILPLGHALYLSKFPPETQKLIVEEQYAYNYGDKNDGAVKLSEFKEEVEENIIRKLSEAPFNPDDARLHLKGLICSKCPERSGFEPRLFDGADNWENDSCLNPTCFKEKTNINLRIKHEDIAAKISKPGEYLDEAVKKVPLVTESYWFDDDDTPFNKKDVLTKQKILETNECENATPALCVKGEKKGAEVYICQNKTCPTHNPTSKEEETKELSEYRRKELEEEQEIKVGLQVRETVFAEAIRFFERGNSFWQYADLVDRLLVETLFARRHYWSNLRSVLKQFPKCPKNFDDKDANVKFVSTLEPFHKSQLLFLVTFVAVGDMSWRYEPQDGVKQIATDYTKLNYKKLDAETRFELAPDEFKPLAQAYLDAVIEDRETEPPKFWVKEDEEDE